MTTNISKQLTKEYLTKDAWKIIENGFHPHYNKNTESICSIGNGKFGQRASIEEHYSGESMKGNYVAGVYYPDKTRVGWWKIGYPEYYSKVLNAVDWASIDFHINGVQFDLAKAKILDWHREIDMQTGVLYRTCKVLFNEVEFYIESERFCSMADDRIAVQSYAISGFSKDVEIKLEQGLDFDVKNEDSNYDEKFWDEKKIHFDSEIAYNSAYTKKTGFAVAAAMNTEFLIDGFSTTHEETKVQREKYIGFQNEFNLKEGSSIEMFKIVSIISSLDYDTDTIEDDARMVVFDYLDHSFEELKKSHIKAWDFKWKHADIEIEGDIAAQQAIRFNIFHLNQTYTGEDSRLNIGPKGFTGEKYGGSTYWDTEAYCIPFYLSTADQKVARQLLIYRFEQLNKAYENAAKLGFHHGEALYPMVTMNGEECHNEWEITFEEIHRNGAIAYAIYNYVNYTGDDQYIVDHGLEVLIGIARFWKSRVHYSAHSGQYMMHGVTGPNEYENNVNNNWYTNYIARWCLDYTSRMMEFVKNSAPHKFESLVKKLTVNQSEVKKWREIIENMYFPVNEELGIFLQQDNYLDKEQILVKDLDPKHLPINQNWSWDRILRSCFIKQADVLQGMYFFEDDFTEDQHRTNYNFYEPRTVHESSLSPCVHSILAAKLGMEEKAYEMYLRTSRLDLDDYNNDTEDGLHITSMAGTWMSVVQGFAGMRVRDGLLQFKPFLPKAWKSIKFMINFRGRLLQVRMSAGETYLELQEGKPLSVIVDGTQMLLNPIKVSQ